MATQTTGGGSTTSFTNTPQANGDTYNYIEDVLYADSTLYNQTTKTVYLDVLSNDLGGSAKSLFSIDDDTGALTDLLQSNVTTGWEQTADGNWIRINAGKIEFKIGDGSTNIANARDVNSLNAGEYVDDTFLYAIRLANGTIAYATVHITISGENDNASISGTSTGAVTEDAVPNTVSGTLVVTDPDAGQNELQPVAAGTAGDNGHGTFLVNADGTWTYTLNNGDSAVDGLDDGESLTDTITVWSEDGTASKQITVTIHGADDAPTLDAVAAGSIAEVDQSSATTSSGLSGTLGGHDVDGDTLTYGITGGAADLSHAGYDTSLAGSYGTLYVNSLTGAYLYVPNAGAVEALDSGETPTDSFTVTVNDGDGPNVTQSYVINLTGADDAPTSSNGSGSTDEDTPLNSSLPAATDVDGDSITYALGTQASHGTAVVNADGTFIYTPTANFNGSDSFTFTISDGDNGVVTYTYNVTVNAVNDAPALTGTQATLAAGTEDTAYTVTAANLLAGFTDVDGDALTVSGLTADHGSVVDNHDGTFTITPDADYNGTVTLSYNVVDGNGGSAPATETFNLAAVNDLPFVSGDLLGDVTEAGVSNGGGDPSASGTMTADDVDNPDNVFQQASGDSGNGYGTFSVDAGGNWTYTLDNGDPAVDALNDGDTLQDFFVVLSDDGTATQVTITIHGAADGIVVAPVYTGLDAVNDHDFDLGVGTSSSPLITGTNNGETINGRTGSGQNADTINALAGDDTVNAGDGGDTVYGGADSDHIFGGAGNDTLYGQAGNDFLYGEGNNDSLYGGSGDDYLNGGDNADMLLNGGSGNDTILGSVGGDIIIGGYGADTLTGGLNSDTFVYQDVKDTGDTITDFGAGDRIDLTAIDADSLASGKQDLVYGGTTATAFGVWYVQDGSNILVYVDTDGNVSTAELAITLENVSPADMHQTDFLV